MKSVGPTAPLRNQRGYTLLEVLIAMLILSVGILGTSKMQLAFMQGNAKANIITTGTSLVQQRIEDLLSRPYDESDPLITNGPLDDKDGDGAVGLNDVGAAADHHKKITINNKDYDFYWNVVVDTPAANNKEVNVIVQWNDEKNVSRQVSYMFVKAQL